MYLVKHLYEQHGKNLGLEIVVGQKGLGRAIRKPEVHRPGLGLAGFLKSFVPSRLLIFGTPEIEYIRELDPPVRLQRLQAILTPSTPAVLVARKFRPPKELLDLCDQRNIPLFRVSMSASSLFRHLTLLLTEAFAPSITMHGTLVEVFGIGVLIQGDSSIGKSEAALGLIERGHRLISDDVVHVKRREGSLLGSGPDLTRHMMEIRGIGIINVANLYGAVCVRPHKGLDIVVKLEEWDDEHFYDRVGLDEKSIDVLDVSVPYHILPVKPGRDVVLLLETIALNHRLKKMGYNSAKEFNAKLLETIERKQKRKAAQDDHSDDCSVGR